jgi:hypothetical protein
VLQQACLTRNAALVVHSVTQNQNNADSFRATVTDHEQLAGSDVSIDVDLSNNSALSACEAALLKNFNKKIDTISFNSCNVCVEEGFKSDKHIPLCLKGLTDMEDMLIVCVKSYMQVWWIKGQQLSYQDHIVNFRQDIMEVVKHLPCLPDSTDDIVIRKENIDLSHHIDFVVRWQKVKDTLEYKIGHDPNYADLIMDNDVLWQLPENGLVADRVLSCPDNWHDEQPLLVGPSAMADAGDAKHNNELRVGGVINVVCWNHSKVKHLCQGAAKAVRETWYERTVICSLVFF